MRECLKCKILNFSDLIEKIDMKNTIKTIVYCFLVAHDFRFWWCFKVIDRIFPREMVCLTLVNRVLISNCEISTDS